MTLRSIGVLSAGKISAAMGVCLGLVAGLLISAFSLFGGLFNLLFRRGYGMGMFESMLGVGAVLVLPLLYGVGGFLYGILGAWLYNLLAPRIGGLELDLGHAGAHPAGRPDAIDTPPAGP
jgi:hypothetical protein